MLPGGAGHRRGRPVSLHVRRCYHRRRRLAPQPVHPLLLQTSQSTQGMRQAGLLEYDAGTIKPPLSVPWTTDHPADQLLLPPVRRLAQAVRQRYACQQPNSTTCCTALPGDSFLRTDQRYAIAALAPGTDDDCDARPGCAATSGCFPAPEADPCTFLDGRTCASRANCTASAWGRGRFGAGPVFAGQAACLIAQRCEGPSRSSPDRGSKLSKLCSSCLPVLQWQGPSQDSSSCFGSDLYSTCRLAGKQTVSGESSTVSGSKPCRVFANRVVLKARGVDVSS